MATSTITQLLNYAELYFCRTSYIHTADDNLNVANPCFRLELDSRRTYDTHRRPSEHRAGMLMGPLLHPVYVVSDGQR